jgi:hypothetical protein
MSHINRVGPILGDPNWVGKLVLTYYDGSNKKLGKTIPFFENPRIRESQDANWSRFSPIGRAGELFAYTGARSRQINITFNITLPHLYSITPGYLNINYPNRSNEESRKAMLDFKKAYPFENKSYAGAHKYDELYENIMPEAEKVLFRVKQAQSPMEKINSAGAKARRNYINLITDYIVAIRSTVLNNSSKPIYGPPVVRLFFGLLYENVPCICTNYSIEADVGAGYDKRTLLPRVIRISMSLLEARNMGRYSTHDGASQVTRDALAGWQYIVGEQTPAGSTTDPWRSNANINSSWRPTLAGGL